MADKKHLEILDKGVEAWNQWREDNPDIRPELYGFNLERADLTGAVLSGANLERADLSGAILSGANLERADLSGANLERADLSGAILERADLSGANLRKANLESVNLSNANLRSAVLSGANLERANLSTANLRSTILSSANLRRANLYGAILESAILSSAIFYGAILESAILSSAIFYGAILKSAILSKVQALETNFDGATLTGACIEDWNINSQTNLKNVKCDCIYLKIYSSEVENRFKFSDRIPHDPNKIFEPGEFAKRYQKILETVELYFGDGIDWQVFLASFQKLQEEEKLKLEAEGSDRTLSVVQTIENTGDGSFVIKVGVSPNIDKGEYEKSFWQKYQPMLEAKEEQIKFFREELQTKRQENTRLMRIVETMAEKEGSKFTFHNPSFTGGVSDKFEGIHQGGDIHNYAPEQKQSLAEAAAEIQQLLDQLQETHDVTLESAQQQVAKDLATQVQNDPKLKDKWISFGKFIGENSAKTIVSEGVKGAIKLFLLMI